MSVDEWVYDVIMERNEDDPTKPAYWFKGGKTRNFKAVTEMMT